MKLPGSYRKDIYYWSQQIEREGKQWSSFIQLANKAFLETGTSAVSDEPQHCCALSRSQARKVRWKHRTVTILEMKTFIGNKTSLIPLIGAGWVGALVCRNINRHKPGKMKKKKNHYGWMEDILTCRSLTFLVWDMTSYSHLLNKL